MSLLPSIFTRQCVGGVSAGLDLFYNTSARHLLANCQQLAPPVCRKFSVYSNSSAVSIFVKRITRERIY